MATKPLRSVKFPDLPSTYVNNPVSIAPQFSTSVSYAAGDYVYYNKNLYRFTADHTAGAWTGSDAVAATIGKEVTDLKADLNQLGLSVVDGAINVSFIVNE